MLGKTMMSMALAGLLAAGARADQFPADKATCVVKGKVNWKKADPIPTRTAVDMSSKKECHELHGDKKTLSETVIVDGEKGAATVRNVLVYVKNGLDKYQFPAPAAPAVIDQVNCVYEPHVVGLMVGQSLEIRNSDPLAHNVHYKPGNNEEFNISQAGKGVKNTVKFKAAELFAPIKCDVHGWMGAFACVLEHPFFAVSDAKGEFALAKLPAGKYTLAAKHETGPEKVVEIEIKEGQTELVVEFEFNKFQLKAK